MEENLILEKMFEYYNENFVTDISDLKEKLLERNPNVSFEQTKKIIEDVTNKIVDIAIKNTLLHDRITKLYNEQQKILGKNITLISKESDIQNKMFALRQADILSAFAIKMDSKYNRFLNAIVDMPHIARSHIRFALKDRFKIYESEAYSNAVLCNTKNAINFAKLSKATQKVIKEITNRINEKNAEQLK